MVKLWFKHFLFELLRLIAAFFTCRGELGIEINLPNPALMISGNSAHYKLFWWIS